MDLKEIQELIKFVSESEVNEVELETKEFKITIKTGDEKSDATTYVQQIPMGAPIAQAPMPQAESAVPQAAAPAQSSEDDSKYITIKLFINLNLILSDLVLF